MTVGGGPRYICREGDNYQMEAALKQKSECFCHSPFYYGRLFYERFLNINEATIEMKNNHPVRKSKNRNHKNVQK